MKTPRKAHVILVFAAVLGMAGPAFAGPEINTTTGLVTGKLPSEIK